MERTIDNSIEIIKGKVLTARADRRTEAGGTVDDDVLEQNAAAGGKIENRIAVNFIADIDLMTDAQIRLDVSKLHAHQMIADHVIVKPH